LKVSVVVLTSYRLFLIGCFDKLNLLIVAGFRGDDALFSNHEHHNSSIQVTKQQDKTADQ